MQLKQKSKQVAFLTILIYTGGNAFVDLDKCFDEVQNQTRAN